MTLFPNLGEQLKARCPLFLNFSQVALEIHPGIDTGLTFFIINMANSSTLFTPILIWVCRTLVTTRHLKNLENI